MQARDEGRRDVRQGERGPEPPPTPHHRLLVHLGDGCALVFGIIQDETTEHIRR